MENGLTLSFGREICNNRAVSTAREWLVCNGIGGYAAGTVAGVLTRRYHGLLVAALQPPLGRTLLATRLDETAEYDGRSYVLYANGWAGGVIDPSGDLNIERFDLEGTTPVWTFACADARLEKRIWMQAGQNTTYIHYTLRRASAPLKLTAKAFVNYRDFHSATLGGWQMQVTTIGSTGAPAGPGGLQVIAFDGATPFYLLSERARLAPQHEWYRNYSLSAEQARGFAGLEDHLYAGDFAAILQPGESLTLIATTDPAANRDGAAAYAGRRAYENSLLTAHADRPDWIQRLVLAADQFIVQRSTPLEPDGSTIIAGYPWFGDWGRDTMISLAGLTLATGRPAAARSILRTFARFVDQGMLPNRFPDAGETPEYNTVDATLWYFEAIRAYWAASQDDELLAELFPVLQEIVAWHQRGTRYQIHLDPQDGLLYAGQAGVQLTWMDARVDGREITPRTGKPVEINALWYHALRCMAEFAERLGQPGEGYTALAEAAGASFKRFWNPDENSCYDVLDGPQGNDASLRPNQLLAVSLAHSPLSPEQQKAVVELCARRLLASFGLRSLAPDHPDYNGRYGGDYRQRDGAYHQGTAWGWLIGPFVDAHLRVYHDLQAARSFLAPFAQHLADHGLGTISEIFDGDPPHTPNGCFAQAWSVAEVLRAWEAVENRQTE